MESVIQLSNVRHQYKKTEVLKGITLDVKEGEILGFLGPSGAGKTTLIHILTGQIRQTSGDSVLLGADTRSLNPEIYQQIGIMVDNLGVYERLSVYDNLKLFAQLYGVSYEKIDAVLDAVGLLEVKKRAVVKLSKGMKGRVAFARAIMNEPRVLFLDEPTSGLDPTTANEIRTLIQKEQQRGATVFLTTHNMMEAEVLCNHIALLNEGIIVEYGTPHEIQKKYDFKKQFQLQLSDGTKLELPNEQASAEKMKEYIGSGVIERIHSSEPSLEAVFMELTGRRLE